MDNLIPFSNVLLALLVGIVLGVLGNLGWSVSQSWKDDYIKVKPFQRRNGTNVRGYYRRKR